MIENEMYCRIVYSILQIDRRSEKEAYGANSTIDSFLLKTDQFGHKNEKEMYRRRYNIILIEVMISFNFFVYYNLY